MSMSLKYEPASELLHIFCEVVVLELGPALHTVRSSTTCKVNPQPLALHSVAACTIQGGGRFLISEVPL